MRDAYDLIVPELDTMPIDDTSKVRSYVQNLKPCAVKVSSSALLLLYTCIFSPASTFVVVMPTSSRQANKVFDSDNRDISSRKTCTEEERLLEVSWKHRTAAANHAHIL